MEDTSSQYCSTGKGREPDDEASGFKPFTMVGDDPLRMGVLRCATASVSIIICRILHTQREAQIIQRKPICSRFASTARGRRTGRTLARDGPRIATGCCRRVRDFAQGSRSCRSWTAKWHCGA